MADIGCAGMLVSDTFCGPVDALPPAGALQAIDALPNKAGGCAANVAIDLAKQRLSVDLAGCLGNDAAAGVLRGSLEQYGVGCDRLTTSEDLPTSQTIILLIKGEDRRYFHVFGANREFSINQIDRDWVASLKAFYLGGLFAMPGIDLAALGDLLAFCRAKGVMTVVDVVMSQDFDEDPRLDLWLPHVDWFLPNNDEARLFTGETEADKQLRALRAAGAGHVVLTMGDRGARVAGDGETWQCGTYSVDAIDPSGSGDAFTAGVIAAAVRGLAMEQILQVASALGASAACALGTTDGVFTAPETDAFINQHTLEVNRGD